MICKIILPIVTPSNNELLRMHFIQRGKLLASYGWELVAVNAHDPKYKVSKKERRYVRIMSYRKKLLDLDNLVGGAKLLIDALVDQKLLFDDSPKYADITYFQKVDRENPRTEIRIFNGNKIED